MIMAKTGFKTRTFYQPAAGASPKRSHRGGQRHLVKGSNRNAFWSAKRVPVRAHSSKPGGQLGSMVPPPGAGDDDRARTAALLASVRASIRAERTREVSSPEPPSGADRARSPEPPSRLDYGPEAPGGLAALLRPPGTPRRRRARFQREWEARGGPERASSTRATRAAAEHHQGWGASSFADVLADRGYRAPRPGRATSPIASPRRRRPRGGDAFEGASLEATLASGRARRPRPAPSPVRHSRELSKDGPGLARRPAYDWGGGLADVLQPVGLAPQRLAEPGPRRRAPASPVEASGDAWGGGLADVLPARGRATTRRRPPRRQRSPSPSPPPCAEPPAIQLAQARPVIHRVPARSRSPPPPVQEPASPTHNADAMLAAQLAMQEATRATEPPRRATERARAESASAFAGGLEHALPPQRERRRAAPDAAYAPVRRRPRNVVAAASLGDAFPARAAPRAQPRYPPPPRPSERARPAVVVGGPGDFFRAAMALPDSALTYDALLALDRPPEPTQSQRRAKEAAVARAVETTVHRKGAEPCECCICLDEFHDRERLAKLRCGHVFHGACIKKWLVQDLRCPTCRSDVLGDASGD